MTYKLETIVSWAKRRGFVYPGSDIYHGLANAWDFGPYGIELKNNIRDIWWQNFVQKRPNVVGLDAAILMNPKVWEASGHVGGFSDPLIDCKKCNNRFRADKIIEEKIFSDKISQEDLTEKLGVENSVPEAWSFDQQKQFFIEYGIKCSECGAHDWSDVKQFNLMFKTTQGVLEGKGNEIYLRPETAQGIFVNFKNVIDTLRVRVPFGIAQVGKAFRNEITPGNFLFRVREFEQMEIEYFVEPGQECEAMEDWKETSKDWWLNKIGIKQDNLRFREHESDELSHYSTGTFDIEYKFPWGWGELQGIASRTDFDLRQHMKHSGADMQYSDPITGKRYVPYVLEPSWGLTRAVLTAMIDAYDEEEYTAKNGKTESRTVLRFHKNIAPIKFAVLPLIKKDEAQVELANKVFESLIDKGYTAEIDINGAIGKRYRRQDEIGTPYCLTIDHQSIEDGTVTIRDRDSMEQSRIKIEDIEL